MGATQNRADKPRLSAADWEQAALEVIAESGLSAVAVEPLARRLGVTKGSFYWHFPNREALIEAALARWEKSDLGELMAVVDRYRSPRERLLELFRRGSRGHLIHTVYSALFSAVDHPQAAPVMERVTERRLQYLTDAFERLGMPSQEARHRARLTYTAYMGFLQLARQLHGTRMTGEEFEDYVEHMMKTLIPETRGVRSKA